MRLLGKVAVIIGPGTYIGRATFLMFAGEVPRAFSRRGRAAHHQSYVHNVDRVKVLIKKSLFHSWKTGHCIR